MKRKLLFVALFAAMTLSCSRDNDPTYCWLCVDDTGTEAGVFRDKTEKWAKSNEGKIKGPHSYTGEMVTCNELLKTTCP